MSGRNFNHIRQKRITAENHENYGGFILWHFLNSAVGTLQTLVIALGAGLGIWGAINLMEGYGNDNPGAKSQGMKQLMAGGGVALIGTTLVPLLSGLFLKSGLEGSWGRGNPCPGGKEEIIEQHNSADY